jgi:hypothetical protein
MTEMKAPGDESIIAVAKLLIQFKDEPEEFKIAEGTMRLMLERRETVRWATLSREMSDGG